MIMDKDENDKKEDKVAALQHKNKRLDVASF